MVRVKKECYFCPAKENFTLSKYKPGDLFFRSYYSEVVLKDLSWKINKSECLKCK